MTEDTSLALDQFRQQWREEVTARSSQGIPALTEPTSTLQRYRYRPLKSHDSIRLLRLKPATHSQADVDCELIESRLIDTDQYQQAIREEHNEEDYEAVSWCWGKRTQPRSLKIHDGNTAFSFPVSADLEYALRVFRHVDKARLIWVDAICINQTDRQERSQQVPRMNQIYGQAKNVCIWVGTGDANSHRAMEFIKEQVLELWDFDDLCEKVDMSVRWRDMSMLMKKPWFSRRWVMQEVALANSAVLYCGTDSIPWQDFADAVSLFVTAKATDTNYQTRCGKTRTSTKYPTFMVMYLL